MNDKDFKWRKDMLEILVFLQQRSMAEIRSYDLFRHIEELAAKLKVTPEALGTAINKLIIRS